MTQLQIERGTVDSDGEDIYWEFVTAGVGDDRPVVVLSHGAGGHHAVWYQQIPALGQNFRVLTWDSRGFGNSTNRNRAPSAQAAASDLAHVLDDRGVEAAHLVGQSMGGWHVVAFAIASSARVESLVLADSVGGLWTPELRAAFAQFAERGGLVPDGPEPLFGHRALWPGLALVDPAQSFLYQALGSFHSPPMEALGTTIQWEVAHSEFAALGVRVLFVAGSHDEIFPPDLLAASSRLIPGARYVEIPAAGHSPYFEQSAAWNDAVGSFLHAD